MKSEASIYKNPSLFKAILKISKILQREPPAICVETGTYRGEMTVEFSEIFEEVHTIELSEKWFQFSSKKLLDYPNVTCYLGDSAILVGKLSEKIDRPALFYLDAHFAGGDTALGEKEVPLMEELEVLTKRKQQDVFVIDDLRLIGKSGISGIDGDSVYPLMEFDWESISLQSIRELLGSSKQNPWLIRNDKIFVFRNLSRLKATLFPLVTILVKLRDFFVLKPHRDQESTDQG
ncbi:MAG: hypothetical protein AAGA96_12215 [Verrucomicrobiota bacterium]